MNQRDERTWATILHLAGIIAFIFLKWGWAGNVVLVLILWLIKRNDSTFVDQQGKEALNFQITISLLALVFIIIGFVTTGILMLGSSMIGFPTAGFNVIGWMGLYGLLGLANIIFSIVAAVSASKGENYRYPFAIRLVR